MTNLCSDIIENKNIWNKPLKLACINLLKGFKNDSKKIDNVLMYGAEKNGSINK